MNQRFVMGVAQELTKLSLVFGSRWAAYVVVFAFALAVAIADFARR